MSARIQAVVHSQVRVLPPPPNMTAVPAGQYESKYSKISDAERSSTDERLLLFGGALRGDGPLPNAKMD